MFCKKILLTLTCAAGLIAVATQSFAKQGGDQYPHGAEGFMAGAVPPPGDYMMLYGVDYRGTLVDNNGDTVMTPGGDIDIRINAASLRWIHVTETKLFGGDFGFHVIVPLLDGEIDIGGAKFSETGIGDVVFDPFIAWHYPNLHVVAGIDIFTPTGDFDASAPLNLGAGYWSFEPLVALTYLSKSGFEASGKFMYNIKTENDDTNYRSGDEFHIDYALNQHKGPWTFGIGGYYVQQTQDDELNGIKVANNKRRSFSIGPQIKYDYKNMSFIAKYQYETGNRNTFEGQRLNLKMIYAF